MYWIVGSVFGVFVDQVQYFVDWLIYCFVDFLVGDCGSSWIDLGDVCLCVGSDYCVVD